MTRVNRAGAGAAAPRPVADAQRGGAFAALTGPAE